LAEYQVAIIRLLQGNDDLNFLFAGVYPAYVGEPPSCRLDILMTANLILISLTYQVKFSINLDECKMTDEK